MVSLSTFANQVRSYLGVILEIHVPDSRMSLTAGTSLGLQRHTRSRASAYGRLWFISSSTNRCAALQWNIRSS